MIFAKNNALLSDIMKAVMAVLLVTEFLLGKYVVSLMIIVVLTISMLPTLVSRRHKKNLPWTLDFLVTFSLFLHTIGVVFDFYHTTDYWWWDKMTHLLGTFVVGMAALYLVFMVQFLGKVIMSIPMAGFFIFMVAMGVGALWEIAEFWNDRILATTTQISLNETMWDLQMNMLGAIIASLLGARFLYVKRDELEEFEKSRELKEELQGKK
jgi:uncharacterized membrane protein YjdF